MQYEKYLEIYCCISYIFLNIFSSLYFVFHQTLFVLEHYKAYYYALHIFTSYSPSLYVYLSLVLGIVHYDIKAEGKMTSPPAVEVEVLDKSGHPVGSSTQMSGTVEVSRAQFWYPYTMNLKSPAYLYTLKVGQAFNTRTPRDPWYTTLQLHTSFLFIYIPVHPFPYLPIHWVIHSSIHPSIHPSFVHPYINSSTSIQSPTNSFSYACMLFMDPFLHWFTCLSIHPSICWPWLKSVEHNLKTNYVKTVGCNL